MSKVEDMHIHMHIRSWQMPHCWFLVLTGTSYPERLFLRRRRSIGGSNHKQHMTMYDSSKWDEL